MFVAWEGFSLSCLTLYVCSYTKIYLPTYTTLAMSVNIHKKDSIFETRELVEKVERNYGLINSDCSIIDLLCDEHCCR